jgi:hypothetical protein
VPTYGLGATPAGPIGQLSGESFTRVAFAPGDHGGSGRPQPLGDLGVGHPLRGQQQDLGPPDQRGRSLGGVVQRRSTAWSWALIGRAAAADGMRGCSRPADQPVKTPQRRGTSNVRSQRSHSLRVFSAIRRRPKVRLERSVPLYLHPFPRPVGPLDGSWTCGLWRCEDPWLAGGDPANAPIPLRHIAIS